MLDISKIYDSNNCGKFKIINYVNSRNVEIEFINTGGKAKAEAGDIRSGEVRDKLKPSFYGVGFTGDGKYKLSIKGVHTKVGKTWVGMLERCYCPKYQEKHPTYKGCTTSVEWHNFQVFAKWFSDNYIDGYHLDKDIKIDGNKTYSHNACLFVTREANNIKAQAKKYVFIDPKGKLVDVYNLAEFCRGKNIGRANMSAVHLGRFPHHKGWTKA